MEYLTIVHMLGHVFFANRTTPCVRAQAATALRRPNLVITSVSASNNRNAAIQPRLPPASDNSGFWITRSESNIATKTVVGRKQLLMAGEVDAL